MLSSQGLGAVHLLLSFSFLVLSPSLTMVYGGMARWKERHLSQSVLLASPSLEASWILRSECLGDATITKTEFSSSRKRDAVHERWGLSPTQKEVITAKGPHTVTGTHTIHLQMTAHEGTEQ